MATSSLIHERVHARTCELARLAGRAPWQVSQDDYEQEKRELAAGADEQARQQSLNHGR